jgi:hypothetical protein
MSRTPGCHDLGSGLTGRVQEGVMASPATEPRSPALANLTVLVGFAVMFTTFATDSPWSWIIGGVMVLAGGLWAGFSGSATAPEVARDVHAISPDAPEVATPEPGTGPVDGTEGREAPHGPGTGGRGDGRTA